MKSTARPRRDKDPKGSPQVTAFFVAIDSRFTLQRAAFQGQLSHLERLGPDALDVIQPNDSTLLCAAVLRNATTSLGETQPFSLDGSVYIVADARIDAREQFLRRLRQVDPAASREQSDVEILWRAYVSMGSRFVESLIGDFSLVIWDGRQQKLFAARDQLGVGLLYYARVGSRTYLCNDLSCLVRIPGVDVSLNELSALDWIVFGGIFDSDATLYRGIQCLPAAHTLEADLVGPRTPDIRTSAYWKLQYRPGDGGLDRATPRDIIEQCRHHIDEATSDRVRSARVSIWLSGGLDSTNVAASVRRIERQRGTPIDLVGFHAKPTRHLVSDEESFATLAAKHLKVPLFSRSRDSAESEAREFDHKLETHSGTILTGLGGDLIAAPDEMYWVRRLLRRQLLEIGRSVWLNLRLRRRRPPVYLGSALRRALKKPIWAPTIPTWILDTALERHHYRDRCEWILEKHLSQRGIGGLSSPFWAGALHSRDVPGKPIQAAHPLVDLRLVDFCSQLPAVPWLVDKHILRETLRGSVPAEVLHRPKTPLGAFPGSMRARSEGPDVSWVQAARSPVLQHLVDRERLVRNLEQPKLHTGEQYQVALRACGMARSIDGLALQHAKSGQT